ncbi:MAG: hypothetical protein R3C49_02015 [Planctomycetaceae bacterium]
MLLTNTINALTTNITVGNGNVICGVALRGCSAFPAGSSERPSAERAAKRRDHSLMRHYSTADRAMFGDVDQLWHQQPQPSALLHQRSIFALGLGSGRSLT